MPSGLCPSRVLDYISGPLAQDLEPRPPATGLRLPKSPKVPERVLGRVPGKRGLLGGLLGAVLGGPFLWETRAMALLPAVPPPVRFFLALFRALSLALWGFGFSSRERLWVSCLAVRHSSGEGGGCVYLMPLAAEILYTPPPPRYFQGWGWVGVYEIWPHISQSRSKAPISTQDFYPVLGCGQKTPP